MIGAWHYQTDLTALFSRIADLPWAVFLDSGQQSGTALPNPWSSTGPRYQLISALPDTTLTRVHQSTLITQDGHRRHSDANPFTILREILQQRRPTKLVDSPLPFIGGAIGWFGYELGAEQQGIASYPRLLPDMAVGVYRWAVLMDHRQQRGYLIGKLPAAVGERLQGSHKADRPDHTADHCDSFRVAGKVLATPSLDAYRVAFERIQQYLLDGDCYQVNLARRFEATVSGDPWQTYRRLRRLSPAPYGAYLSTPDGQVLCNSPEQFLGVDRGTVVTQPIKGTRPRSSDPERDRRLAHELSTSPKDRAENVMIVDLLRNDLGRVCRPGTVKVEGLCALQSYATVHHLVSTISGRLHPGRDALDLLHSAFPGGSITGAPKRRAMQIIRELEPHARGIYCGSIGYLDWRGRMDSNIAIRTLIHQRGRIQFHAGGGIVADSVMEQEFQETLDKAAAMLRLLDVPPRNSTLSRNK